jgi:hypothetical protein
MREKRNAYCWKITNKMKKGNRLCGIYGWEVDGPGSELHPIAG